MKTIPILLLAIASLTGCVHKARHFDAPDAAPLQSQVHRMAAAVGVAKDAVKRASDAIGQAKTSHAAETARIAEIAPKVEELLRLSPVELRPLVESVQGEVASLREIQGASDAALEIARSQQSLASAKLEEATAARNELTKLADGYLGRVNELADRVNASEIGWAKDSKSLWWYRGHLLLCSVLAAGAVLIGVLAWLGKLGGAAARVASKF